MDLKIAKGIIFKKIEGTMYAVDAKNKTLHSFNSTAELILEAIRNNRSRDNILENMISEYDVDTAIAENDIENTINSLLEKKIVLIDDG